MKKVKIYTDGSSLGNPGFGGWGFCVVEDNIITNKIAGSSPTKTTNNVMELFAIRKALVFIDKYFKGDVSVEICSDSAYCLNSLTQWASGWKQRGWRKSNNKIIENVDLMRSTYELYNKLEHRVRLVKVKAHSGDKYNDVADQLAVDAANRAKEIYAKK